MPRAGHCPGHYDKFASFVSIPSVPDLLEVMLQGLRLTLVILRAIGNFITRLRLVLGSLVLGLICLSWGLWCQVDL